MQCSGFRVKTQRRARRREASFGQRPLSAFRDYQVLQVLGTLAPGTSEVNLTVPIDDEHGHRGRSEEPRPEAVHKCLVHFVARHREAPIEAISNRVSPQQLCRLLLDDIYRDHLNISTEAW